MIIKKIKWLGKNTEAMTVWPFIFVNPNYDLTEVTIRHESIHGQQQKEMLLIPFYIWYFVEYGIRYLKYGNADKAYKNISFEREAYSNQSNPNYKRIFWGFISYL